MRTITLKFRQAGKELHQLLQQLMDMLNVGSVSFDASDFAVVTDRLSALLGDEYPEALTANVMKYAKKNTEEAQRAVLMSLYDVFQQHDVCWEEIFSPGESYAKALRKKDDFARATSSVYFSPTKVNVSNNAYEALGFQRFWNYDYAQYVIAPDQDLLVMSKAYWKEKRNDVLATLASAKLVPVGRPLNLDNKVILWYMDEKKYSSFVAYFGLSFWGAF